MTSHVPDPLRSQLDAAIDVIVSSTAADALLGVSLYGSAVSGQLRPDSDLDLLVVTRRRLITGERRAIVDGLLPISGRETRRAGWRPLDVTVVAQPDVRPWRYPPRFDLQYGEWLRGRFIAGDQEPWPETNPDVAVLVTMARYGSVPLVGPSPSKLLDPVPRHDLVRAMIDELPLLLGDLEQDTRNVLLTLARMWCTVATGDVRSKDGAADWAAELLESGHRQLLLRARDLYRDGGSGTWELDPVRGLAGVMVARIQSLSFGGRGSWPPASTTPMNSSSASTSSSTASSGSGDLQH